MSQDDLNNSVVGHLFLAGKPLVLNYQLMENRLARPRLTPAQRAEYNRQLNNESGFLTVADREGDDPLLIHFRWENHRYTLRVATPGRFFGYFLSMEKMQNAVGEETAVGNLMVVQEGNPTRFYLDVAAPGNHRLMNVSRKPVASASESLNVEQDRILGPTYLYSHETRLRNDAQQYFSDTFLKSQHVIWDPVAVELGVQVRGAGVLEFSDIG